MAERLEGDLGDEPGRGEPEAWIADGPRGQAPEPVRGRVRVPGVGILEPRRIEAGLGQEDTCSFKTA